MSFFEWLASSPSGYLLHEVDRAFMVFATVSLLTFGVLLAMTGKLVVDAWKALRDEARAARVSGRSTATRPPGLGTR